MKKRPAAAGAHVSVDDEGGAEDTGGAGAEASVAILKRPSGAVAKGNDKTDVDHDDYDTTAITPAQRYMLGQGT